MNMLSETNSNTPTTQADRIKELAARYADPHGWIETLRDNSEVVVISSNGLESGEYSYAQFPDGSELFFRIEDGKIDFLGRNSFRIAINSDYINDGESIRVEIIVKTSELPNVYNLDPNTEPDENITGGILFSAWNAIMRGSKL